jgi:hypothetical protein
MPTVLVEPFNLTQRSAFCQRAGDVVWRRFSVTQEETPVACANAECGRAGPFRRGLHTRLVVGSSLKDGRSHSNDDLPVACVGRAGGALNPAGHAVCPADTHIADLHLTTLPWFGI